MQVLIDQQRNAMIGRQLAQDLAHRALAINDRVAGARADPLEQLVEPRVVERPRQHGDRDGRSACTIACISQ